VYLYTTKVADILNQKVVTKVFPVISVPEILFTKEICLGKEIRSAASVKDCVFGLGLLIACVKVTPQYGYKELRGAM